MEFGNGKGRIFLRVIIFLSLYASVQIGIIPEQQDDQSSLTVHFKSSASMTLDKGYRGDKLVTFTSSSLQKYPS